MPALNRHSELDGRANEHAAANKSVPSHEAPHEAPREASLSGTDEQAVKLIELLFFGYRDFVGEADRVLANYGFGRAHHRVLHFVGRSSGLTIAELLSILDITKQSLARVLRELTGRGFIESRSGVEDRRQRHLFLTDEGKNLVSKLISLQKGRVSKALQALSEAESLAVETFLQNLRDK